jgi:hypothetical protein
MIPPYERTDDLHDDAVLRTAARLAANDLPYRTTYRCVRLCCAMTLRLLDPIDRCPRCSAVMAVIARPQFDLGDFVVSATEDIVAGFEALLDAGAPDRDDLRK